MDALKIVACPFCGVMPNNHHGSLRMVHKDYCFFSKAKNLCAKYMSLGWEDTIQAWNDRAGGRNPTVPETESVKALASATGSTDSSEAEIKRLREINSTYWRALMDIKKWTDSMEAKWGDPGYRARAALEKANP